PYGEEETVEAQEVKTADDNSSSSGSDSEDYDTDLDCETTVAELFSGKPESLYDSFEDEPTLDVVRLEEYKNACKKLQAVPQSVILRNLGDRVLDLRHRNVGSRQLQPLFVALKENMRVQKLLLEEVGLDSHGAQSLANGLAENVTVSYLSLSGNPLGAEGLVHVVCLLRSNKIIQSLDLSDTQLGGEAVPLLSHLIKENSSLRFLDLSRNKLEDSGLRALAAAIGENTGLEFLRLAWNRIRLNGAAAIGQCLTVNGRLRVLDVSWNGLGYQGAVGFADGLKDNDVLQELDLSHNTIHWDAAQVLAKGLAKNSTLKILRMGGNPISTTGAMDLMEAASTRGSGVPVILETEVLAASLGQSRGFRLIHGGVVFIHDVFGRRYERNKKPMERLLDHIRERMIRPLEMLREFDKSNKGHISQKEFMERLKRAKVPLHPFEVKALTDSVSELHFDGTTQINYVKLMESIERYILLDRIRKWRERMHQRHMREYHTRILKDGKPMYPGTFPVAMETPTSLRDLYTSPSSGSLSTARHSKMSAGPFVTRGSSQSLLTSLEKTIERPKLPVLKTKSMFNMSAPLDEIGRRKKRPPKPERRRKKQDSRRCSADLPRETTTLIGKMKS
ncbi:hypothetical protein BaRGS_00005526, partial [Batillaria attramentaria]